ncbi:MAG: glycoside hydrolase family 13 protein [Bacteroidales bacterium]|nr:glycoside hydrolase family 13 protein [Bacteroidales bacterium]
MKIRNLFFSITLILVGTIGFAQNYKIKHLEPAFWWTGMEYKQIQILVHGDQISELSPSFSYPNLKLDSVIRTDNSNYLFLYLSLNEEAEAGKFDLIFKKGKKEKLRYTFELKERRKNSAQRIGFNNSDAIYLITPDRFANAIPENDEVNKLLEGKNRNEAYGRHGGDLQGIIDHLDYIQKMGFTAIWLNPVLENNVKRSSYHGYSTTDYYKVDARFGSNADYVRLSEEASKRGIKLIMDQIMNHCGLEHWWTKDMPTKDWYHYPSDIKITNHRRTTLSDPYASKSDKELFENGWFVQSMPDLNQSNHLLADYLIQNSIWWVEYANLGGIRHDTHPYSGKEFMAEYACRIMQEYPNFNIVGEEWSPNPAVLAKWQNGKNNPDGFKSCLPSLMDFPLHIALLNALHDEENWNKGFINLYEMLSNDFMYPNPENLVIFPDNHDMQRFYTQINEDFNLFKTALIYVASTKRIPQIFYGTEYLATSPEERNDGLIRSDFPGGWKADKINAFTGRNLSKQQLEAQNFVRKLFNWRKENSVIHNGKLKHFAPENGTYVYFRYNKEKTVMVILNKNKENTTLHTERFNEIISGYTTGTDVITGIKYNLNLIDLPAKTSLLLELSK